MNPFYLLRNEDEGISEAMLEYMMGTNVDAEKIFITKTNSFQWVRDFIMSLEAKHDETCFLTNHKKSYLEQVNKNGEKQKQFSEIAADICVTDNNEIYFSDLFDNSISHLSLSRAKSIIFSTDPLQPLGICYTMNGELLSR